MISNSFSSLSSAYTSGFMIGTMISGVLFGGLIPMIFGFIKGQKMLAICSIICAAFVSLIHPMAPIISAVLFIIIILISSKAESKKTSDDIREIKDNIPKEKENKNN